MRHEETAALERLTGADPGVAVTEEELARSREKSLAVRFTDSEQLVPGGSIDDFHQRRPRRRFRLAAGAGLAAAAVLAGVFVASSLSAPLNDPIATIVIDHGWLRLTATHTHRSWVCVAFYC